MNLTTVHKLVLAFSGGALLSLAIGIITIQDTVNLAVAQATHKPATMPTRIDVNGIQFDIEMVDVPISQPYPYMAVGGIGHTVCARHRIYVRTGYDTREILLHELQHTMVCYTDKNGGDANNMLFNSTTNLDHEGIYVEAEMWRELYKRNPGLGEYLGEDK